MRLPIIILVVFSLLVSGCSKNGLEGNCQKLKSAMINGNKDQARSAINDIISQLPNQNNTSQNLDRLAREIDVECDIDAEVLCFDCVKTLPSQSEIKLSFQSGSTTVNKIIDITYNSNNKMKFSNMHE